MPTLKRFRDSRVLMYIGDHPPPHVHIKLRDGRECTITLHDFRILGRVDGHEIREALAWVALNQFALFHQWREYHP